MNMNTQHSGVCTHSSDWFWDRYVVFCVGQSKVRQQAFKAWAYSNGIKFKELVGAYKGVTEASFITNEKNLDAIMPWIVQEESILVLDVPKNLGGGRHVRPAKLIYGDGREVSLPDWRQVHRDYAMDQEAWTYDPQQQAYFVAG